MKTFNAIIFFLTFPVVKFVKRLKLLFKEKEAKRLIKKLDEQIFNFEADLLILSVKAVWTPKDIEDEIYIKKILPILYHHLRNVNKAKMFYETQRYILS